MFSRIFLKFRLTNRHLLTSNVYYICQKRLLNEYISNKQKLVRTLEFKLTLSTNSSKYDKSFIDFLHIISVLLASNYKNISKFREVHAKKRNNLF